MQKVKPENISCSVVIPVYNTADLIRNNLPKVIAAWKNKENKIIEIIVVDDASPDESASVVKKEFPEVKLIKHTKNRGFSASVNTGARASKGTLIVLLNSDVIPSKDFLVPVHTHFEDPAVFAVSLHEKGYLWARAVFENGYIHHPKVTKKKYKKVASQTFWVNGGSGVFRRDYWMKLGGMDEKLLSPFYKEDLDLSYRAAKRGFINLWEPEALVLHEHQSTIGRLNPRYVSRIMERNELLVHWKNITSKNLFRKHLAGLVRRVVKHPGYLRIVLMAVSRLRIVIRLRKKELKESKISDEGIFAKFKDG